MPVPKIRIEQQMGRIGLNINRGGLKLDIPRHNIELDDQKTKLEMEYKRTTFDVNMQKQYSEAGLKAPLEFTSDFKNKGKVAALRAAKQAKDDGNFLGNIKQPPIDKVPLLAKNKANARLGPKEFNIGLLQPSTAEINWDLGSINTNWSKHSVNVDFSWDYLPNVDLDPMYSVEVYLAQRPYVRVSVESAPATSGRYIDSTA